MSQVSIIIVGAALSLTAIVIFLIQKLVEKSEDNAKNEQARKVAEYDVKNLRNLLDYANLAQERIEKQNEKMANKLRDHSLSDDEWLELYEDPSKINELPDDTKTVVESTPKKT